MAVQSSTHSCPREKWTDTILVQSQENKQNPVEFFDTGMQLTITSKSSSSLVPASTPGNSWWARVGSWEVLGTVSRTRFACKQFFRKQMKSISTHIQAVPCQLGLSDQQHTSDLLVQRWRYRPWHKFPFPTHTQEGVSGAICCGAMFHSFCLHQQKHFFFLTSQPLSHSAAGFATGP